MKVASGSYTGNGSSKSITGLGFQPAFVWVQGGSNVAVLCLDAFGANQTRAVIFLNGLFSGGVTSLTSDGFTVGSDATVNSNSVTYYWLALAGNGNNDFETGSYTGNNT